VSVGIVAKLRHSDKERVESQIETRLELHVSKKLHDIELHVQPTTNNFPLARITERIKTTHADSD